MNKLAELHLDGFTQAEYSPEDKVPNYVGFAKESAIITEQVAIEFAEWCNKPSSEDLRQGNVVYVPSGNFYWHKHEKYTPKELFQEFLKTKQ